MELSVAVTSRILNAGAAKSTRERERERERERSIIDSRKALHYMCIHTRSTRDTGILIVTTVMYCPSSEGTQPDAGLVTNALHIIHPYWTTATSKMGIAVDQ